MESKALMLFIVGCNLIFKSFGAMEKLQNFDG